MYHFNFPIRTMVSIIFVLLSAAAFANPPIANDEANTSFSTKERVGRQLPWPTNPTKFKVVSEWSWDAKAKNPNDPKAGSLLPDYGTASAIDINDHINMIWNACKGIKFIPGENITKLSHRIQGSVDNIISQLPYTPTEAEEDVLRSTGNDTFVACNLKMIKVAGTGILDPNAIVSVGQNSDPQCREIAQAMLNSSELLAHACVHATMLKMALDNEAGVLAFACIVVDRDRAKDTAIETTHNPQNHMIEHVCLPTKIGASMTPSDRRKDSFTRLTLAYCDPTASVLSDDERRNLDHIIVYPRPETSMVGVKGDDILRVYDACHYGIDRPSHGVSYFRVTGFGEGTNMTEKSLPPEVDKLFKEVQSHSYLSAKVGKN